MDWKFLFASFDGRISRQPFWIGFLVLMAANLLTNLVIRILFGFGAIGGLLSLIAALVLAYGAFAVLIKRCHDRGKSGWKWSVAADRHGPLIVDTLAMRMVDDRAERVDPLEPLV